MEIKNHLNFEKKAQIKNVLFDNLSGTSGLSVNSQFGYDVLDGKVKFVGNDLVHTILTDRDIATQDEVNDAISNDKVITPATLKVFNDANYLNRITNTPQTVNAQIISNNVVFTDPNEFVSKAYVDAHSQTIIDVGTDPKESVLIASNDSMTGFTYIQESVDNGTSGSQDKLVYSGTITLNLIDTNSTSSFLGVDKRVLVKNRVDAKQNGIYSSISTSTLQRAKDQDGSPVGEVSGGNFTYVESGTYENKGFILQGQGDLTLNVDNLNWVQFSSGNQINAGDGLELIGQNLNVVAGPGISVTTNVAVDFDYTEQNKMLVTDVATGRPLVVKNIEWSPADNALSGFSNTSGENFQLIFNDVESTQTNALKQVTRDNWTETLFEFLYVISIKFNDTVGFAVGLTLDTYTTVLYKTINNGLTWSLSKEFPDITYSSVKIFFFDGIGYLVGSQVNGGCVVYKTTNDTDWYMFSSIPDMVTNDFIMTGAYGIAVGYIDLGGGDISSAVSRTTDTGETWSTPVNIPTMTEAFSASAWEGGFENIIIGGAAGSAGCYIQYNFNDDTYGTLVLPTGITNIVGVQFVSYSDIVMTANNTTSNGIVFFKSTDNGTTFIPTAISSIIYCTALSFADDQNGYIAGVNSSFNATLLFTNDGGATWKTKVFADQLIMLNVYATTTNGVFGVVSQYFAGASTSIVSNMSLTDINFGFVVTHNDTESTYISNLETPQKNSDAANKRYVDSQIESLKISIKPGQVGFTKQNKVLVSDIATGKPVVIDNAEWNYTQNALSGFSNTSGASFQIIFNDTESEQTNTLKQVKRDNWSETLFDKIYFTDIKYFDYNIGYALGISLIDNTSILYRTTDNGKTWVFDRDFKDAFNNNGALMTSIKYFDGTGYLIGTNFSNSIIYRLEYGNVWNILSTITDMTIYDFKISFGNGVAIGVNITGGIISRTTDSGFTWSNNYSISDTQLLYSVDFYDLDNIIIGGQQIGTGLACYIKYNFNDDTYGTLEIFGGTLITVLDIEFTTSTDVYMLVADSSSMTISKSEDSGSTWTHTNINTIIYGFNISFSSTNEGYISGYDNTNAVLLFTTDAGLTWNSKSFDTGSLNYIFVQPGQNKLFGVTSLYSYSPSKIITNLIFDPSSEYSNVGFAVTYNDTNQTSITNLNTPQKNSDATNKEYVDARVEALNLKLVNAGKYTFHDDVRMLISDLSTGKPKEVANIYYDLNSNSLGLEKTSDNANEASITIHNAELDVSNSLTQVISDSWRDFTIQGTFLKSLAFADTPQPNVIGLTGGSNINDGVSRLYRTTDGGLSWLPVSYLTGNYTSITAIANVQGDQYGYVAAYTQTSNTTTVFTTSDFGITWQSQVDIQDFTVSKMFFVSSYEGVAIGYNQSFEGCISFTTDQGATWSTPEVLSDIAFLTDVTSPTLDLNSLIIVGKNISNEGVIIKYVSSTVTNIQTYNDVFSFNGVSFIDDNTIIVVGASSSNIGITVTSYDAGDTFESIVEIAEFVNINDIVINPSDNLSYMIGSGVDSFGLVGFSSDLGATWTYTKLAEYIATVSITYPKTGTNIALIGLYLSGSRISVNQNDVPRPIFQIFNGDRTSRAPSMITNLDAPYKPSDAANKEYVDAVNNRVTSNLNEFTENSKLVITNTFNNKVKEVSAAEWDYTNNGLKFTGSSNTSGASLSFFDKFTSTTDTLNQVMAANWDAQLLPSNNLNNIQFSQANEQYGLITGLDGALYKTTDTGVSWRKVLNSDFTTSVHLNTIFVGSSEIVFYFFANDARTGDGDIMFFKMSVDDGFVNPIKISTYAAGMAVKAKVIPDVSDPQIMYAIGSDIYDSNSIKIIKSTNGGYTWAPTVTINNMFLVNDSTILLTNDTFLIGCKDMIDSKGAIITYVMTDDTYTSVTVDDTRQIKSFYTKDDISTYAIAESTSFTTTLLYSTDNVTWTPILDVPEVYSASQLAFDAYYGNLLVIGGTGLNKGVIVFVNVNDDVIYDYKPYILQDTSILTGPKRTTYYSVLSNNVVSRLTNSIITRTAISVNQDYDSTKKGIITNLDTPVRLSDATNKEYVDSKIKYYGNDFTTNYTLLVSSTANKAVEQSNLKWQPGLNALQIGGGGNITGGTVKLSNTEHYQDIRISQKITAAWEPIYQTFNGTISNIVFFDDMNGSLTNSNLYAYTTDGGETWISQSFAPLVEITNVFYLSSTSLILFGTTLSNTGCYMTSSDGGENWSSENTIPSIYSIVRKGVMVFDSMTFYVVGYTSSSGNLFITKTDDGGTTWSATADLTNFENGNCNGVFFVDLNNIYAYGTDNSTGMATILISTDAGDNWIATNVPTTIPNTIQDLVFSDGVGYAALKDNNINGGVLKSFDDGNNWNNPMDVPTLDMKVITSLVVTSDRVIVAGNDSSGNIVMNISYFVDSDVWYYTVVVTSASSMICSYIDPLDDKIVYFGGGFEISSNPSFFLKTVTGGEFNTNLYLAKDIYGNVNAPVILSNVDTPVSGNDAANKSYVDSVASGVPMLQTFNIVGNGLTTSFNCTHNKATRAVQVQVYEEFGDYRNILVTVSRPSTNQITVNFDNAPITGENYTVTVL